MSSNRFHLAIEAGDLTKTVNWYKDVLGCELDMAEEGKWQDIDFWGNELTLHASEPRTSKGDERNRHKVAMGEVCVPHFGVHLSIADYKQVRASVAANNGFLDEPYIRFEGTTYQQETFFVEDPNFNVLEIKHLVSDRN
ncbi:MAG: glyoxalase [Moritella sp.]|uniref:VOC family protein n=1 Tax=Moritella sp. TaxID=78556 RepID=UPI001DFB0394|nr:VOC family protein [Moritella sp.]NQZ51607.1 glyoxalase [Moritella sp.]